MVLISHTCTLPCWFRSFIRVSFSLTAGRLRRIETGVMSLFLLQVGDCYACLMITRTHTHKHTHTHTHRHEDTHTHTYLLTDTHTSHVRVCMCVCLSLSLALSLSLLSLSRSLCPPLSRAGRTLGAAVVLTGLSLQRFQATEIYPIHASQGTSPQQCTTHKRRINSV